MMHDLHSKGNQTVKVIEVKLSLYTLTSMSITQQNGVIYMPKIFLSLIWCMPGICLGCKCNSKGLK